VQAIVIREPGEADVLEYKDVPDLKAQRGEVLVRVKATAVNRADVLQRQGKYPPPPGAAPDIPGLEFSGEVAEVGDDYTGWRVGDRVFGLTGGGSYAQYILAHPRTLSRIPEQLSYEEAASLPEACITAYDAMVSQCDLKSGEIVLINGITSGVGTAALQIANAIGANVIGSTRSASKIARLEKIGTLKSVVVKNGKFAQEVIDLTNGGADVALELIGGGYVQEDLLCLALKGRIILVGLLAGAKAEILFATILAKRLQMFGTTMRGRPLEEKILAAKQFQKHVVPMIASGQVKPVIDRVFALSEAAEAHRFMESNESFGKIVLSVKH
jgi:NADPH2:quinone reductase